MRSFLLAATLAAGSVWGIVRQLPESEAQASPHASRPREVESVALDGRGLPVAALRDAMVTRAGDQLDAPTLEHDRAAMRDALANRGYLAATVGVPQVSFDDDGGAFVTFAIEQGTRFHVRSVRVTGAAAKDAGVVTLAAGEVASPARFDEARQALTTRLIARGKPASVVVQLASDAASGDVDVTLVATR